ncbi:serine hydrolase [Lacihabitans sp. LS3-19]|uniref:serine hydrolase n=1 Tax=Lacihabitans sp. LS3-19 TaxID=2487335 RepID=UPI0020CF2685|nr:serine hydrolase [Lacihabitans sp. LS3-19]MCP9768096.1 serine hydrolase [Lacihabitans sp. LS3-19]
MKNCSRLFFLFLILSANYSFSQKNRLETLENSLNALHEKAMFNGVVLVAKDGKAEYQKAFGISDYKTKAPLSINSAFNLASISKQFVAMMIMIQKDRNQLAFDDLAQKHLPNFPYPNITIRQLLTHTSGLPEYFDLAFKYNNTLDTLDNHKMLQLLVDLKPKLNFEPGEKWEYCNTAYLILALIIEKNAGMPFEDFLKKEITAPLGLKNTYAFYLNMKNPSSIAKDRVMGFERVNGENQLNDLMRFDGVVGDGNIYSSAEDLLIWANTLDKLVKPETLKEAYMPVKLNNGSTYNYGFGWAVDGKKLSHTGSWVGFFNSIERNLEDNSVVISLSNSTNFTARKYVKAALEGKNIDLPMTELITNIKLIDGTGNPARNLSVRILDKKIWEIGKLKAFKNETVIDGKGKVLAPGFIDSHSHHFGGLEKAPEAIPTANQGITTIVIGQDGGSYPMDTIENFMKRRPVAVNIASYTGHATLRGKAMGVKSLYRKAKPEEIEKMKGFLEEEMKKGSLGLNTGLEYESAFFSNKEEVIELAKTAAKYGGKYMSHIRSEDINLNEAIDEIIEIGRITIMPVQISHIKIAKKDQWEKSSEILAQLQKARAEGINITADCYPYNFWNSTLRVLFPNRDYTNPEAAEFAVNQLFDPSQSVLVRFAPNKTYAGKTITEIAKLRNEKPSVTLMNLIAIAAEFEEKNPNFEESIEAIMAKSMHDADVSNFLNWPQTNICSDGSSSGHPRGHGTFTRVLAKYVREQKLMPLETAIYKMTGLSAEHLGIKDRGIIAPGNYADLVLFDPNTVKDNADIKNGKALSTGIEKVWINGEIILENNKPTGKYPGVLIKRATNE